MDSTTLFYHKVVVVVAVQVQVRGYRKGMDTQLLPLPAW